MSHLPGKESAATRGAGGAAAADRAIHASARAHRTFGGTLLRVGVGAAAAYGLWHMWQHSEEPLPKPATEAKRVATISDAASTGISLQADRRARNQRWGVHITLELPWSADKAIQQFGRSHRSNQASAPHYCLLVTPLAGESRFASAAAKRLATLGALLHGSRHATGAGSELKSFDVDNKHGAEALDLCLTSILGREFGSIRQRSKLNVQVPLPQVPEGFIQDSELLPDQGDVPATQADKRFKQFMRARLLSVGLFKPDYSGQPRMPDKKVEVRSFLNKLLGMRLEDQELLFSYFAASMDKASTCNGIRLAQLHASGIMTIKGSSCQVDEKSLVQRDELTGAEVHHVKLSINRGDLLVTAGGAKRPKLIVLASEIGKTVTGSTKLAIARPNSGDCGSMTLQELKEKGYRLVADEKAQVAWTFWHEYTDTHCVHGDTCPNAECTVGGRHQSLHILSGAVLPIMPRLEQLRARSMWGRIGLSAESTSHRLLRIVKAVTSQGENIVGIEATVGAEMKHWKDALEADRKKVLEKEEAAAVAAAAVAQAAQAAAAAPIPAAAAPAHGDAAAAQAAAAVAAAVRAAGNAPAHAAATAVGAAAAAEVAQRAKQAVQEAARQQAAKVAAEKQAASAAAARHLAQLQAAIAAAEEAAAVTAEAAAEAAAEAMALGGPNVEPAAANTVPGLAVQQEALSVAAAAFAAADAAQQAQQAVQVKAEPAIEAEPANTFAAAVAVSQAQQEQPATHLKIEAPVKAEPLPEAKPQAAAAVPLAAAAELQAPAAGQPPRLLS